MTVIQEGLQFVAFFHFTSPAVSVMFESCFLHVLTKIGVETFNIPTLRPIIFNEEPVSRLVPYVPIEVAELKFANFQGSSQMHRMGEYFRNYRIYRRSGFCWLERLYNSVYYFN